MTIADLATVAHLAGQLGYPTTVEDLTIRYQALQNSKDYGFFVARSETGKIADFLQVNREAASLLSSSRAEIAALVVDHQKRGLGIGAALLKAAEAWARVHQFPLLRIRSNTKRTDAHRFYQKNGFEIPKSWHLFTKEIELSSS